MTTIRTDESCAGVVQRSLFESAWISFSSWIIARRSVSDVCCDLRRGCR